MAGLIRSHHVAPPFSTRGPWYRRDRREHRYRMVRPQQDGDFDERGDMDLPLCAVVLVVAVIWQTRIWRRPRPQLDIKFDSQVLVPSMQAQEAVILVAGTIINPRDTPTSVIQLSIIVRLTDGSVIEAQPHFLPLPQTLPFKNELLTFTQEKFWLFELEKNQIPAHGASHGFMFGYVSGFSSSRLFDSGTAITLRCKDSDGITSVFTATKKADKMTT